MHEKIIRMNAASRWDIKGIYVPTEIALLCERPVRLLLRPLFSHIKSSWHYRTVSQSLCSYLGYTTTVLTSESSAVRNSETSLVTETAHQLLSSHLVIEANRHRNEWWWCHKLSGLADNWMSSTIIYVKHCLHNCIGAVFPRYQIGNQILLSGSEAKQKARFNAQSIVKVATAKRNGAGQGNKQENRHSSWRTFGSIYDTSRKPSSVICKTDQSGYRRVGRYR